MKLSLKDTTEMVRSFMEMAEQEIPDLGEFNRKMRSHIIKEDYEELIKSRTKADQLYGMCNLLYSTVGTMLSEGVADSIPNFTASDNYTPEFPIYMSGNTITEINHFFKVVDQIEANSARVTIARMLRVLATMILGQGTAAFYDFHGAFQEVHRNNMNKLWTEEEIKTTAPTHSKTKKPNGYVVKDHYLRLLKPPSWIAPSLSRYLEPPVEEAQPIITGSTIRPIPENFIKK